MNPHTCSSQSVPNRVREVLGDSRVLLSHKLQKITRDADGVFELRFDVRGRSNTLRAKSVVLTCPAYVCAPLLKDLVPQVSMHDLNYLKLVNLLYFIE
jgi:predicted NAD/FAD-dependent oxidoreductase